jgi:hypothetical protein
VASKSKLFVESRAALQKSRPSMHGHGKGWFLVGVTRAAERGCISHDQTAGILWLSG